MGNFVGIFFLFFFVNLVCAFFVSWLAITKNYGGGAWFLAGFFFGFIALIAIAGAPAQPLKR